MDTIKEIIKFDSTKNIYILKPSICPYCNKGISAVVVKWFFEETSKYGLLLFVVMKCPICGEVFMCSYSYGSVVQAISKSDPHHPFQIIGGGSLKESFSEEIKNVSPSFVKIYNQAFQAEQEGLHEIDGIGYRKAFEYLIKDYAISLRPDDKDTITKMSLSQCIDYIFSKEEKRIVEKTGWIGNDQTHYEKKHDGFGVEDFKKMIMICISKIETSIREKKYLEEISDKGA